EDEGAWQRLMDGMATLGGPPGLGAVDGQEMREPKHAMGDGREDTPSPEPDIGWRGLGSLTAIEKHQQVEQPSRNDVAPPRTSSEHGTGELELPHEKFAREWDRLAPVFVKGGRKDPDRSAHLFFRKKEAPPRPAAAPPAKGAGTKEPSFAGCQRSDPPPPLTPPRFVRAVPGHSNAEIRHLFAVPSESVICARRAESAHPIGHSIFHSQAISGSRKHCGIARQIDPR